MTNYLQLKDARFATGRKNHNRFEINGSKGSVVFNLERMNELEVYKERGANSGFKIAQNITARRSCEIFSWPV
jgi:hypothetical protein